MLSSGRMVRTVVAWTFGTVNTIVWGSLSLLGSLFDPSGAWAHRCMVRWSRINLRLMATRIEVSGLENVLRDGPQVFAANHESLADILVLAATLPVPFRFVAKRELFDIPFLGWHMRRAGFVAIDRGRPQRAARTLIEASRRVREGVSAVVFPEGTRSHDGLLLPFRGGGFLLAMRAGVPIVPVAIRGTGEIVRKGEWTIRPATARIALLPAIPAAELGSDRDELARRVREAISETFATTPEASPR